MSKKPQHKKAVRKVRKAAHKVRVRKIKVAPAEVVRIIAHEGALPIVLHPEPGVIEVVPVKKGRAPPKTWWDTLFGY